MGTVETRYRIRYLNDCLRRTFVGGRVLMSAGIAALADDLRVRIFQEVQIFEDFYTDNDPYHEHDFGSVSVDGVKAIWKIDYYALDMLFGSEDPSDEKQTVRVLTITTPQEY